MIVLKHDGKAVVEILNFNEDVSLLVNQSVVFVLEFLSKTQKNQIVVWCHQDIYKSVDFDYLNMFLDNDRKMVSYQPEGLFLTDRIGYVEFTPFIKVNKEVIYPTWQMSSCVGGLHLNILNQIHSDFFKEQDFDFFLNSIAKQYQPYGLFCYSNPKLLKTKVDFLTEKVSIINLFRFVRMNYKIRWVFLLLLNIIIFERKIFIHSLIRGVFSKKIRNLNTLKFQKNILPALNTKGETVDVVIPTIGRKKYLYDILCDIKNQNHLPINVIIVEQNPDIEQESELNYLHTEEWPFNIIHEFTHRTGACNARNIALSNVKSKWVFLADDDIRIEKDFIEKCLNELLTQKIDVATLACYQKDEIQIFDKMKQWTTFGSGCSFLLFESIATTRFDLRFEFGFGEDIDFGLQIRNKGIDVVYLPEPFILHLKAPIGGFRVKPDLKWKNELFYPKPSPTVMLCKLKYDLPTQILGYRITLFFKFFKKQKLKNPFLYYYYFTKQWNTSQKWAKILLNESKI